MPSTGGSPTPSRRRFFTRNSNRQKDSVNHVGRADSVQAFYEAPDFDAKDPKWVEYAPPSLPKAKKDKHEGAAIQTYRRRNPTDKREGFFIEKIRLQSPHLREALQDSLEKYGVTWRDNLVADSIAPHHGLFFNLDRIAELAKTAEKDEVRSHCKLLCSVVEDVFEETLDKLEELEEEQKITFELLWTLFPEGSFYVEQFDTEPPQGLRVKSIDDSPVRLKIIYEIVVFDGYRYGTMEGASGIYPFEGAVRISAIPGIYATDLARTNTELWTRLMERGRKSLDLQSIEYMTYKPNVPADDATLKNPWLREEDTQRVIIDPHLYRLRKQFWEVKHLPYYKKDGKQLDDELEESGQAQARRSKKMANHQRNGEDDSYRHRGRSRDRLAISNHVHYHDSARERYSASQKQGREGTRRPSTVELEQNRKAVLESEENLVMMYRKVSGYSIDKQAWDTFCIDNLHPADVDESVFEKVVLDETKKDVIKTLVESHKERSANYDDLISGKGQCLLIILSGPPGTGKTLMAESLAEHLGCPLLRADSQYFQPDWMGVIQGYDANLGQFLKDATEWGGLVLFDEPDFLFQNQESSVDRKDLLAFLRHAEYFKGIIILTTNLGRTIDPAVISRVQIHLSFPSLTKPLRVRVWENFIERLPDDVGTLSPIDVARLSTWKINGREIKNILNMAVSWCCKKKLKLSLELVESLLTTICPSAKRIEDDGGVNGHDERVSKSSDLDDLSLLDI